ncbi:MAG: hypothetical protein R6X17_07160 [Candidatus Competibacteraceae bacterium]
MRTPLTGRMNPLLLLALLIPASVAFAQAGKIAREQMDPAWRQAHRMLDGVLDSKQQSELNVLAYSTAVANLCEGFALNREQFKKGFNYLAHGDAASMKPEESAYFERHLLVNYGVAVGLFLAEGAADQAGFCKVAATHRGEAAYHYWQ